MDMRARTEDYVAAFDARDIDRVGALMSDGFTLTDPSVSALGPRQAVLDYIAGIFESAGDSLSFAARTILCDGRTSAIEFTLRLGDKTFDGVDIISWGDDGLMTSMRAHLTEVTEGR